MSNVLKQFLIQTGATRAYFSYQMRRHQRLGLKKGIYILSFDLDYEKDVLSIPAILKILSKHGIPASFACIGKWIEKHPAIHKEILAKGHEILNHTYSHPDNEELNPKQFFHTLSREEKKKEIAQFHAVCRELLHYKPIGFRTPHFGRQHTKEVYTLLKELDYRYSSSVSAHHAPQYGLPYRVDEIMEIPLSCSSLHPRCVFDSWSSRTSPNPNFKTNKAFLEEFAYLLDITKKRRAFMTQYFDPWHVVENNLLARMCELLVGRELEVMTYQQFVGKKRERGNE